MRGCNVSYISVASVVIEKNVALVVIVEELLHLRRPLFHSGADEVHVNVREGKSWHRLFLVELQSVLVFVRWQCVKDSHIQTMPVAG